MRAAALALALTAASAAAVEPPTPRPPRDPTVERVLARPPTPRPAARRSAAQATAPFATAGALCGDRRLRGTRVAPIAEGACGVTDAVRLEAAAGVRLDPAVTVDCAVGGPLADWIDRAVQPAAMREAGAPVTALRTFAGYACRGRNNLRRAPLSLHGKGLAIDIGAFRFADGREITVLEGWRRGEGSAFLRSVWRGACGPFGTVLGPNADRWHVNHLHLDVADHEHGDVCR